MDHIVTTSAPLYGAVLSCNIYSETNIATIFHHNDFQKTIELFKSKLYL